MLIGLQPGVLVVKKHHVLVRWSHWLKCANSFSALFSSGISIYWASPGSISTNRIQLPETSM